MKKNRHRLLRRARRGNVIVLTAFLMIGMMGMIAFAVDLGYLYNTRTEMQRAADASAIAGCWELIDQDAASGTSNAAVLTDNARASARSFVAYNQVTQASAQLTNEDIRVGYIADPTNPSSPFLTVGYTGSPNAVQIRLRRTTQQNGAVPLFFGPVLGAGPKNMESYATAAYLAGTSGFKSPGDGSNLGILPYALDEGTWNAMLAGGGSDNYRHTDGSDAVTTGPDGIREVNLFPQGTGSPGNRGTVDIGSANNSTSDIARQIVHGISPTDMGQMPNSKLEFNSEGKLYLTGDTGISAGIKDELGSIVGDTRMIPLFSNVTGNGNNASYTIVKFVGIRVMNVKLTGNNKQVMVQPAVVVTKGGIPSSTSKTQFIHSPVWLVR
jgi:Flp pilus assembly protein TadG